MMAGARNTSPWVWGAAALVTLGALVAAALLGWVQ